MARAFEAKVTRRQVGRIRRRSAATRPRRHGCPRRASPRDVRVGVGVRVRVRVGAVGFAEQEGRQVAVVVVDRSGRRGSCSRATARPATRGAGGAARRSRPCPGTRRPTRSLQRPAGPGRNDPHVVPAGAVPVAVDGAPIGGIGVADAPGGDLDEKYAAEGLKAIAGRPR
nr:heme-binding protein [Streptomyces sp. SID3343]